MEKTDIQIIPGILNEKIYNDKKIFFEKNFSKLAILRF
jgi:hypothetical protein